jgi:hypothetical protein
MMSENETPGRGGEAGGNMSDKIWQGIVDLRRDASKALSDLRGEFNGRVERMEDRFDGYCRTQSEHSEKIAEQLGFIRASLKANELSRSQWIKIVGLIIASVASAFGLDVAIR